MGRQLDRRLQHRPGRRAARHSGRRYVEGRAARSRRFDARSKADLAGPDAADVPDRSAVARARSGRRNLHRRSRGHRSERAAAPPGDGCAGELQADLPGRFRARRTAAERTLKERSMNKPRAGSWRVGEGWDVHALTEGRKLVLGGVEIPHTHGLDGHSDADALCHAITDALFGAAALGDIGHHFPDTDAQYRGADSLALLSEATRRVKSAGWQIGNVDSTVIAQAPRL